MEGGAATKSIEPSNKPIRFLGHFFNSNIAKIIFAQNKTGC
jgi:hypothetical protein